jgi:hypothetical protein
MRNTSGRDFRDPDFAGIGKIFGISNAPIPNGRELRDFPDPDSDLAGIGGLGIPEFPIKPGSGESTLGNARRGIGDFGVHLHWLMAHSRSFQEAQVH